MNHLDPFRFYELASKLHALFTSSRVVDMLAPLTEAQALLDGWIKGDVYALETSKNEAEKLLNRIGGLFQKYYIDQTSKQLKAPTGEDRIDTHELMLVATQLDKFEHALAAELCYAPTYTASKCGIYSTYDLIENTHLCFSERLRAVMPPAALHEFGMAGRALAFEFGTAAGLHLLRAIEIVLKLFYETFSGTQVGRAERTYAIYLKKLAALSDEDMVDFRPDKRLLQMLAQIKEQYRNPMVNPESQMSMEQAASLFGLATAAITLMAEQIIACKESGAVVHKPVKDKDVVEQQEPLQMSLVVQEEEPPPVKQVEPAVTAKAKAALEDTLKEAVKEEKQDGKGKKEGDENYAFKPAKSTR
ncbi:MAG: hypothetical protein FWF24_02980 [Alphaproteobacteria bacterium]|nr:hypothetical protein [Alphaproteobacteria bacterium]